MHIHLFVRFTFALCAGALFVGMLPPGGVASASEPAPVPALQPRVGPKQQVTFEDVRRPAHVARAYAREMHRLEIARRKAAAIARLRAKERARARERARLRFVASHRCPVDRPRIYSNDFGAPRTAGGPHAHEGIDIVAPFGTPVRAPWSGWLERRPNPNGGIAVRLWGNGGYLYVSHLLRYPPRFGRVRAADVIGYVGNSGAARGGPPHAHVEWHPGGGRAVNPYRMLNELCGPRTRYDRRALRLIGL